jgi:hypothetical protein
MTFCAHCGVPFEPTDSDATQFATYCSQECEQLSAESLYDDEPPREEDEEEDEEEAD